MKKMTLEDLKKVQLDILKVVSEYCDKNDIKYFLAYGTLIGAVRHKGYIPWDDDIDIVMTRPDYDKFLNSFNEYSDRYEVAYFEKDRNFLYTFAKVCDNTTVLKEDKQIKYPLGVNIDIFPLDGIKDDYKLLKKQIMFRRILDIKNATYSKDRKKIKSLELGLMKALLSCISTEKIIKTMIEGSKSLNYDDCDMICNTIEGSPNNSALKKELFSDCTKAYFEGQLYNIPICYDEWLRAEYGNYMKLPPKEKQVSPHNFEAYYKMF